MKRYCCLLLLSLWIFSSCTDDNAKLEVFENNRPYSPWVFRSVLDEKPRMITLALHDDLWAAYSTAHGALYKAWKGRVNFDGAVYTTYHGPQPTSIGDAYIENEINNPWELYGPKGESLDFTFNYKGHKYIDDHVELMYEFISGDYKVSLTERVEAVANEMGGIQFQRDFQLTMPSVLKLYLNAKISSVVVKENISTDGEWKVEKEENRLFGKKEVIDIVGKLKLNRGETKFYVDLISSPTIENPLNDKYVDEDKSVLHPGAKLIAKSDCKSCHNKNVKTIGPSYVAVSKKYADNEDNKQILINKIQKGGGGVWGKQVMTAHPEYSKEDLGVMVDYILSLGDPDGVGENKNVGTLEMIAATDVNVGDLIPGAVVQVFNVPDGTEKIPNFDGLKAVQAGIMPKFDNISDNDFGDLVNNFALDGRGFIEVPEDGKYKFRVWSDDGSRVTLSGKVILDHDGPHGTSMKETELRLQKGFHPFYIEFYQGLGGKFLSFNWKPDAESEWKVVPSKAYSHHKDDHKFIGDLTLPMSVSSKIPGDQAKLEEVHPAFTLSQARPEEFTPKVGGLDFLSDGRMVISTWDAQGNVYIVDHKKSKAKEISYKKIASGLAEPLGVKVVNDQIYVMQKQEMTHLVDNNGDEIIDEYRTLCDDWGVSANFHEFGFGLEEKDGWLYANLATGILPGGASMPGQDKDRGNAIRVNIESGKLERVASGLRTPNGVGKGYNGELFVSDNEGDWLPSSKILHLQQDAWFGSRSVDFEGTAGLKETKPVVWLPQDEIGNSPTQMVGIDFGKYKNQMLHGDVYHGGLKRVFVEEVNGAFQGAVFRFSQGLEAGINRLRWGPDKALYVGGIGNPGNWGQNQKLWYGLQRLDLSGEQAFEMLAIRAKSNGIEIEFTESLKGDDGWNPASFGVKQWYYLPTVNYGGPKMEEKEMFVKSATRSDDGTKVFLEIDGLKENHVVYVHIRENFVSDQDKALWTTEGWYTMNSLPKGNLGLVKKSPIVFGNNVLTEREKEEGWVSLFNGQTMEDWHNFNKGKMSSPSKWSVTPEGEIHFDGSANGEGGDILTNKEYENFEFSLEWKISNCGNSGIMFNVVESEKFDAPYWTGPEMQILDNVCHPDTKFPTHQAGDLYDMIAANPVTVRPAGEWNLARIVSNNGEVQFWLNGRKVVEFTMHDDSWDEMVAKSKFADWADFGKAKKGRICLQDHSDRVWFRNIKIKEL